MELLDLKGTSGDPFPTSSEAAIDRLFKPCPSCWDAEPEPPPPTDLVRCSACKGIGWLRWHFHEGGKYEPCRTCGGSGKLVPYACPDCCDIGMILRPFPALTELGIARAMQEHGWTVSDNFWTHLNQVYG